MKIKHSKFKNTGLLYELLVRQFAADHMNNVKESASLKLIKKYFNNKSELHKELELYQLLMEKKFKDTKKAEMFLEAALKVRKNLNLSEIRRQRYNLINDIQKYYNKEEFFKFSLPNYKELASTYILFEYEDKPLNPSFIVNAKMTLLENFTSSQLKNSPDISVKEYQNFDSASRVLAYKILVNKFNEKYRGLLKEQKDVLKNYINYMNNSLKLKEYINKEISILKEELKKQIDKTTEEILKIKLKETYNILKPIPKNKLVNDKDVLNVLSYHNLVSELKKVNGKG